ncbi:MAG: hypothetical protein QOC76_234 [Mycobacterium sp.]|jgi:hypothetical protein|nr:hypothetical protein [Mycobacterium sp.]
MAEAKFCTPVPMCPCAFLFCGYGYRWSSEGNGRGVGGAVWCVGDLWLGDRCGGDVVGVAKIWAALVTLAAEFFLLAWLVGGPRGEWAGAAIAQW